jgi:hypothetical protein
MEPHLHSTIHTHGAVFKHIDMYAGGVDQTPTELEAQVARLVSGRTETCRIIKSVFVRTGHLPYYSWQCYEFSFTRFGSNVGPWLA